MSRKTDHTRILKRPGQAPEIHPGTRYSSICHVMPASATHIVQRGTKRPSGNVYRKTLIQTEPREPRTTTGSHQDGWTTASRSMALGKVAVPKTSRVREANIAIRSADLRQNT